MLLTKLLKLELKVSYLQNQHSNQQSFLSSSLSKVASLLVPQKHQLELTHRINPTELIFLCNKTLTLHDSIHESLKTNKEIHQLKGITIPNPDWYPAGATAGHICFSTNNPPKEI